MDKPSGAPSELDVERQRGGTLIARHDPYVAVGAAVITLVEEVVHVQRQLHLGRELPVSQGTRRHVGGQLETARLVTGTVA
ncbi:hypothetical protein ABTD55_21260, partial [Acinetobacter baumannii]